MQNYDANPLKRFSNRVDNYIKYRPDYPDEIIDLFINELKLNPGSIIADIGSGTGIFTELLLKNNFTAYAIEPNNEMREAAERLLSGYSNFTSVNGSAEVTGLETHSMDLITSAQAFHWFNPEKAKIEFKRILKDNGWAALIWNSRIINSDKFMIEYENLLLKFSVEYSLVNHTNLNKKLFDIFYHDYKVANFPNKQSFDFEGLKGRLLSSSYAPDEKSPSYIPMINKLNDIFRECEQNGKVHFLYNTEVYYGKL
jgi:ubiquinone/menaquinone biosynthesis C-methylase UbiE